MKKQGLFFTILTMFVVIFCIGADTFLVSPLIPVLTKEFGITTSQGGLLTLSYALAYALFAFILGPISDRVGRRRMLLGGMVSFTLCTLGCGIAKSFYMLLTFRALSGIAAATSGPQVWALIGDVIPFEKRGKIVGIVTSALAVSQLIGLPIGSYIAKMLSWNYSFYVLSGLAAIATVFVMSFIPKGSTNAQAKRSFGMVFTVLGKVLRNKQAFAALMVTFFMMFGSFGLFTFLGAWLAKAFNMNVGQIGTVMMAIGIGNMCGQLSGGFLADKFGKRRVAIFSMPIMSVMLLILPRTAFSLSLAIAAILVWFFSAGISLASFNAHVTELMPTQRGTIMSLNSSFMYMGTSCGVAVNGYLLRNGDFSLIGVSSFIAAICAWIILATILKNVKHGADKKGAKTA